MSYYKDDKDIKKKVEDILQKLNEQKKWNLRFDGDNTNAKVFLAFITKKYCKECSSEIKSAKTPIIAVMLEKINNKDLDSIKEYLTKENQIKAYDGINFEDFEKVLKKYLEITNVEKPICQLTNSSTVSDLSLSQIISELDSSKEKKKKTPFEKIKTKINSLMESDSNVSKLNENILDLTFKNLYSELDFVSIKFHLSSPKLRRIVLKGDNKGLLLCDRTKKCIICIKLNGENHKSYSLTADKSIDPCALCCGLEKEKPVYYVYDAKTNLVKVFDKNFVFKGNLKDNDRTNDQVAQSDKICKKNAKKGIKTAEQNVVTEAFDKVQFAFDLCSTHGKLFVSDSNNKVIEVIDIEKGELDKRIKVDGSPKHLRNFGNFICVLVVRKNKPFIEMLNIISLCFKENSISLPGMECIHGFHLDDRHLYTTGNYLRENESFLGESALFIFKLVTDSTGTDLTGIEQISRINLNFTGIWDIFVFEKRYVYFIFEIIDKEIPHDHYIIKISDDIFSKLA